MPISELHTYLCAYDFEVEEESFTWEVNGERFHERRPAYAAESFLEWHSEAEGIEPQTYRVVVLDRESGEITRWDVKPEITYTVQIGRAHV